MNQQVKTERQSKRGKKKRKKKALATGAEFQQGWNLGMGGVLGVVGPRQVGVVTFKLGAGPRWVGSDV